MHEPLTDIPAISTQSNLHMMTTKYIKHIHMYNVRVHHLHIGIMHLSIRVVCYPGRKIFT